MKDIQPNNFKIFDKSALINTSHFKSKIRKFISFLGPAFMVAIGYMDPGNWSTDLQGGASFGYQLIFVLILSNIMAIFLQSLCSRLGIVSQQDLAQITKTLYPKPIRYILYFFAELAIISTDIAEIIGMAIGLKLLFGIPLMVGTIITLIDTFLFLILANFGIRKLESIIVIFIATICFCFVYLLVLSKPDMHEVIKGAIPTSLSNGSLYIAIGIIGATVMPHNLYLHSSLVQTRIIQRDEKSIKQALKYNFIDSLFALNIAFVVNVSILILAASLFYKSTQYNINGLEDVHHFLEPMLGSQLAPILFALALIAAGQSSTITGTIAGQIVMEGFLNIQLKPWLRRLLTRSIAIIPCIIILNVFGERIIDKILIFSQFFLSIQLVLAIIPLIIFLSNRKIMQAYTLSIYKKVFGWAITILLISLNLKSLIDFYLSDVNKANIALQLLYILFIFGYFLLIFWIFISPLIRKKSF